MTTTTTMVCSDDDPPTNRSSEKMNQKHSITNDVTSKVIIPKDGWYILSFGTPLSAASSSYCTVNNNNKNNISEQQLLPMSSLSSIQYNLIIQQHPTTTLQSSNQSCIKDILSPSFLSIISDDTDTLEQSLWNDNAVTKISLPLIVQQQQQQSGRQQTSYKRYQNVKESYNDDEDDNVEKDCSRNNKTSKILMEKTKAAIELDNIYIGQLIYLTQNCILMVLSSTSETTSISSPKSSYIQNNNNHNIDKYRSTNIRQWSIQSYPYDIGIDELVTSDICCGTIFSQRKKSLICYFCYKSFISLRSIQHHIDMMHIHTKTTVHNSNPSSIIEHHTNSTIDITNSNVVHRHSDQLSVYEQPLHILYEDPYMAIINKPQGMTVMGGKPSLMRCELLMSLQCTVSDIQQIQQFNDTNNSNIQDKPLGKPRPVHRLDNATGGILVIAKTHHADRMIRTCFMERKCQKRYRAVLIGKLQFVPSNDYDTTTTTTTTTATTISPYITLNESCRDDIITCGIDPILTTLPHDHYDATINAMVDGKESQTNIRILRYIHNILNPHQVQSQSHVDHMVSNEWFTLVDLWPITGRKHQLRKHMKMIGYSIYGDIRYRSSLIQQQQKASSSSSSSDSNLNTMITTTTTEIPSSSRSLCLWAIEITIPHPMTGQYMTIQVPNIDELFFPS